ncbi:MAG: hypothetical protein GOVbin3171_67 [Prokaryotic dsDNA virus sp.]|nr:MAG: hypothetical protein GOVbin3171_67 [Prokaryotic dsDNA virus sp.]|tara:strand:- start:12019 stop:12435 length:417 start_codon:yes stop_codon:yes gene_type:complete
MKGKKYLNPTHVHSVSYLRDTSKQKGDKGRYKSRFDSTSLLRDLNPDMNTFSGTGAYLRDKTKEKGEIGRAVSIYKGVTKNKDNKFVYTVNRQRGEKANTRSRVITEKSAARKMRRMKKKHERVIKRNERRARRIFNA